MKAKIGQNHALKDIVKISRYLLVSQYFLMFPNDAIYCFRDISRYKTLNPGCDTTSAGVLGKWNFRWQSIILVNTVVLVPGIQELLCYGQQHHMPLWLCGRSVVQMFLSHLKVLPFSCHKVCKKCHLWRLWSASPGGCPPQQHLLLAQHWSLEARALGVGSELVQKVPPVVEVWHFPTQICSCDSMWKLEGGQVWSPILEERWEREDF